MPPAMDGLPQRRTRDGAGKEVTVRFWNFTVHKRDTAVPTYGPNGLACANGNPVDGAPMDETFTCDCDGTKYEGDNCEVATGHDNTTAAVVGAGLGVLVLAAAVLVLILRWQRYTKSMMATDFLKQLQAMKERGEVDEAQAGRGGAVGKRRRGDPLRGAPRAALEDEEEAGGGRRRPSRVDVGGPVSGGRRRRALVSADGTALRDPPLAFEACRIVVEAADDDAHPAVADASAFVRGARRADGSWGDGGLAYHTTIAALWALRDGEARWRWRGGGGDEARWGAEVGVAALGEVQIS